MTVAGYVVQLTMPRLGSGRKPWPKPEKVIYPVAVASRRLACAAARKHASVKGDRWVRAKVMHTILLDQIGEYGLRPGEVGNGTPIQ